VEEESMSSPTRDIAEVRNLLAREFKDDLRHMDEIEYHRRRNELAEFHSHGPLAGIAHLAGDVSLADVLQEYSNLPITIRTGEDPADVDAAKRKLLNMDADRELAVDRRFKHDEWNYYQLQDDPHGPIQHHQDHGDYVDLGKSGHDSDD
jgi:hypothetical protein